MDKETLRRATEPFFTTKGPGKDTGLGLSMAHGIAEQSGGRFMLRSKVGEGTTAELWLPIADAKIPEIDQAKLGATSKPEQQSSLVVVAVDDNALVVTNTIAMLEDLGHTALRAASSKEALQILRQQDSVDLVITDQAMPNMTGVELAEAIQKDWPDIAVIIASGFAELDSEAGLILPTLSKPFTEADLAKALARVVPRRRENGRVLKFRTGAKPAV